MVRAGFYKTFQLKSKGNNDKSYSDKPDNNAFYTIGTICGEEKVSGLSVVVTIVEYSIKSLVRILWRMRPGKTYLGFRIQSYA